MSGPTTAGYGAWASPLGADAIAAAGIGIGSVALDGDAVYWVENRPLEAGRAVIVRHDADGTRDVLPAPFNARSSVHEYGGGAFAVHDGWIYFVHFDDGALYQIAPNRQPQRIGPRGDSARRRQRFADLCVDARRRRLLCVCEDHDRPDPSGQPTTSLVAIGLDDGRLDTLAQGDDFYASPALSDDGAALAWLCWQHPQMPWDGTELWRAELDAGGAPLRPQRIAGGPDESIFQPQWGPDGQLYYVSDRSDWWNLYRYRERADDLALAPGDAEYGLPQWVFGMSTYGFDDAGDLIAAARRDGRWQLWRIGADGRTPTPIDTPFCDIDSVRVGGRRAAFIGAAADAVAAVVTLDLDTAALTTLRRSSELRPEAGYISVAEAIRFDSADGRVAHAFYYPPVNRDFRAPDGETPPLLVKSHGGPTASTSPALNLSIQYWTSRGFAVVDVNYGGSTGYGRRYRRSLYGRWGEVDVQDCVAAARHLIDSGRADGERCAIRGNSAGGYTTLAALTFSEQFSAGASYYGISDLEILARDTHKFESRYLDQLIGPYPQQRTLYRQRSPIHHIDRLAAPVIFFQGLQDRVVPPNQAELMAEALRAKDLPVALVTYAEEGHGFRQSANIRHALEAELYFYGRLYGFDAAGLGAPPVIIDGLDDRPDDQPDVYT